MTDLERRTQDIKARYGDYLSQREFMEAAGVSSRTAYLATKRGKVPHQVYHVGTVRYYRIKAEDVARFMEGRFQRRRTDGSAEKIRSLKVILRSEPDVLSIREASVITGIHKNSIARWIQKGLLRSFRWKGDHRIPKGALIDYMASPRYWAARSNSLQREAIRMAMEWMETQREKYGARRKETENDDDERTD